MHAAVPLSRPWVHVGISAAASKDRGIAPMAMKGILFLLWLMEREQQLLIFFFFWEKSLGGCQWPVRLVWHLS